MRNMLKRIKGIFLWWKGWKKGLKMVTFMDKGKSEGGEEGK